MSNRRDIQFTYSPHNKKTVIDCNFIVDSTNGNGFGVRSLDQGGRIATVYMKTSATKAPGSPGGTTGPATGIIYVTLQDNYDRYLGGFSGFVSPLSGSPISSGLSVGSPYIITSLSATTAAQWQTAGLPANITPAVGVAFIAAATSVAGGGTVEAPATTGSGIDHIEVFGDVNLMNSNGAYVLGAGNGMTFVLGCFFEGALTAPANGTVIALTFELNNSAQGV